LSFIKKRIQVGLKPVLSDNKELELIVTSTAAFAMETVEECEENINVLRYENGLGHQESGRRYLYKVDRTLFRSIIPLDIFKFITIVVHKQRLPKKYRPSHALGPHRIPYGYETGPYM
jgi:hypothetical protein